MQLRTGVVMIAAALLLSACGGGGSVKPEPRRPAPIAPGDDAPRSKYGNPESYEVYGKTYRVLPTARGYSERGLASWYGEDFHGKRTSSGEPYNMHAMTAAHKTLPLPTYVRVTNLQNRREIIVRVNDRGPFHDDRIIDLSFAAATELGIVRNGTAEVEVTTVDPVLAAANPDSTPRSTSTPARTPLPPPSSLPATTPSIEAPGDVLAPDEIPVSARAGDRVDTGPIIRELPNEPRASTSIMSPPQGTSTASAQPSPPVPARGHYLQTGAFSDAKNADSMIARLRHAGFDQVKAYSIGGVLKVRVGPYPNASDMHADYARLTSMGIKPYLVEE